MKARTAVGITLACVLAILSVVNGGAASAQFTFERSPAEGPRGTVIKVSGTGCIENGKPYEYAFVYFYRHYDGTVPPYDTSESYPIRPDGTWSGDFVVAQDAPPGNYGIRVTCEADDMSFPVGEADFVVNSDPPIPPPSTTTTTTATTSTTTTVPPKSASTSTPTTSGATRRSPTTSTTQAVPSSTTVAESTTTSPPTTAADDDTEAAAPASTERPGDDGGLGTWPVLAVALGLPAAAGTALLVRRRRRGVP